MERLLWLDDKRNPADHGETDNVKWVRSYLHFVRWITKHGIPKFVSFDHDLAEEHYVPEKYWVSYDESAKYQEGKVYYDKTGLDCSKWLVKHCIDNRLDFPHWSCHSENPVGKDKILFELRSFAPEMEVENYD